MTIRPGSFFKATRFFHCFKINNANQAVYAEINVHDVFLLLSINIHENDNSLSEILILKSGEIMSRTVSLEGLDNFEKWTQSL